MSSPWMWREDRRREAFDPDVRCYADRNTPQPERGSFFVTEAASSRLGTGLVGDGATFDPNQRGHIGVWFCRGNASRRGAMKSRRRRCGWTRRSCSCSAVRARSNFATEGVEGGWTGHARIVTGGTGNFAGWVGEQRQTFLGFNPTAGQPARDVHSAAAREVGAQSVPSTR